VPTPSHRAASAAKGQGSGGPVRRRRKTGTLVDIPLTGRSLEILRFFGMKNTKG